MLVVGMASMAHAVCPNDPTTEAAPGVDWSGCDLRYADLRGAHLSDANLSGAGLRGAVQRYACYGGFDDEENFTRGNARPCNVIFCRLR